MARPPKRLCAGGRKRRGRARYIAEWRVVGHTYEATLDVCQLSSRSDEYTYAKILELYTVRHGSVKKKISDKLCYSYAALGKQPCCSREDIQKCTQRLLVHEKQNRYARLHIFNGRMLQSLSQPKKP